MSVPDNSDQQVPKKYHWLTGKSMQTDANYKFCLWISATVSLNIQQEVYKRNSDPEPKLCSTKRIHWM